MISATLPLTTATKSSTERQLELTLNAIARSMRKAIRLAEKEDPAGSCGHWKVVEHRAGLLESMLKAAAQFMGGSQVQVPAAQPEAEAPALVTAVNSARTVQKSAQVGNAPALKQLGAPAKVKQKQAVEAPKPKSLEPAKPQTSGQGWRVVAQVRPELG